MDIYEERVKIENARGLLEQTKMVCRQVNVNRNSCCRFLDNRRRLIHICSTIGSNPASLRVSSETSLPYGLRSVLFVCQMRMQRRTFRFQVRKNLKMFDVHTTFIRLFSTFSQTRALCTREVDTPAPVGPSPVVWFTRYTLTQPPAHPTAPSGTSRIFQAGRSRQETRKSLFLGVSALWLLVAPSFIFAQIDTARKEFFPLHIGDLWEYRNASGNLAIQQLIGDTLLDSQLYLLLIHSLRTSGGGITRVDSLLRVQNRGGSPTAGDSCGGGTPYESSTYRLGEPDSAVWPICDTFYGMPSMKDLVRFNGITTMNIFGQRREVMEFDFGGIFTSPDPHTAFGFGALLARGIGVLYEQYFEFAYCMLQGAIIDGVKFGTIVSVGEKSEALPVTFSLSQNFPNPFNPSTLITYELQHNAFVELKVHDLLGREVKQLVGEYQQSGSHSVLFNADGLAGGTYIYTLKTSEGIKNRKMIYLK